MAQEFVQAQIKGDKVVLFMKPGCSYCVMAKNVLSKYKFKPGHLEYIDISCRSDMGGIQDYFLALTGARTVLTHTPFVTVKCGVARDLFISWWFNKSNGEFKVKQEKSWIAD